MFACAIYHVACCYKVVLLLLARALQHWNGCDVIHCHSCHCFQELIFKCKMYWSTDAWRNQYKKLHHKYYLPYFLWHFCPVVLQVVVQLHPNTYCRGNSICGNSFRHTAPPRRGKPSHGTLHICCLLPSLAFCVILTGSKENKWEGEASDAKSLSLVHPYLKQIIFSVFIHKEKTTWKWTFMLLTSILFNQIYKHVTQHNHLQQQALLGKSGENTVFIGAFCPLSTIKL